MKMLKKIPGWAKLCTAMTAAALFARIAIRGYDYLAYATLFAAALIVAYHVLPAVLWRIIVVLVCIGLVYFCFVEALIIGSCRTDKDCGRKYVVVLGAAVYGDEASPSLLRRVNGAADYLSQYPDSVAILSGGRGKGENITEAECMYNVLVRYGIDESRLIMEGKATSTMENLLFSYDIIRARGDDPRGNVAILSTSYHLYRAKEMSKRLGVEAVGVAGHRGNPIATLNFYVREAFGVTHLWVFGK